MNDWVSLVKQALHRLQKTTEEFFREAAKAFKQAVGEKKLKRAIERFEKKSSVPEFVKVYLSQQEAAARA